MPKKHLGQHFLIDQLVLEEEASVAKVKGKRVLEIGPGTGNLTEKLLEHAPKEIVCVEKDPDMVDKLLVRFHGNEKVRIVKMDFLEFNEGGFDRIVGNLPYYISSPILFKVADMEFKKAVFCLQKEFVQRMAAKPGDRNYSRLSVEVAKHFVPQEYIEVPAEAFSPKPKVDSAIIVLAKKKAGNGCEADKIFVRAIFSHRKKTLRAAIVAASASFLEGKHQLKDVLGGLPHMHMRVFKMTPKQLGEAQAYLKARGIEALV